MVVFTGELGRVGKKYRLLKLSFRKILNQESGMVPISGHHIAPHPKSQLKTQ